MSSTVADPPAATSTKVYTKEELDALKRALAAHGAGGSAKTTPPENDPNKDTPWEDDVNSLIRFLTGLKRLMRFLIEHRVPEKPRTDFLECFPEVEANIDSAIEELKSIDSPSHALYAALQRLGLIGKALRLKIGEFIDRIGTGPIVGVLEMADDILESLFKVLTQLEPVKEFKEALLSRIKYGADQEIIELNI